MRCELFDVEVERLTFFSTFTQRSLEEAERIEIAPAAELAPEHRELAEIAAAEAEEEQRPDIAEVLPVDRFRDLLSLVPDDALVAVAAEEELPAGARRLLAGRDHELPRRGRPPPVRLAGRSSRPRSTARTELSLSSHLAGPAARVPRPGRRQRRQVAARRPSPSSRSWCARATGPWWRGRVSGEGERAALQPGPAARRVPRRWPGALRAGRDLRHREPARGLPRAQPQAGAAARAPAAAPPPRPAARGPAHRRGRDRLVHGPAQRRRRGARGPRHRALHRLRDEDRGRRDARLPGARVQGRRPRLRAERPAPQDQPLRGRRRRRPAALEARRQAVGAA